MTRTLPRNLLIIGLVLLVLALVMAAYGSTRPSSSMTAARATTENLSPPTRIPTQTPTKPPTSTSTPKLTSTPPRSPIVTPTPEPVILYTVRSGDTLFSIARRYSVTVETLIEANDVNPNALYVGQTLKIQTQAPAPTPGPTGSPTLTPPAPTRAPSTALPTPTEAPRPTPAPTLVIEMEWLPRMQLDSSDSIRISLVNQAGTLIPTVEAPGRTAVAETPFPFSTPGVPLEGAYGSDYDAFVIARLAGTAFELQLATAEEYQWLNQARVTWEWNIIPKIAGAQIVNATLQVRWKNRTTGQTIEQAIWRSRLEIAVERPWLTTGQISLFTVVSGVLGSGLSVPWVYERVQEWRKGRGRKKAAKKK